MCDRYGPKRGWAPWEIELLKGAMICEDEGDDNAIRDCAEILCRSYEVVRRRSRVIEENARRELSLATVRGPFRHLATWLERENAKEVAA